MTAPVIQARSRSPLLATITAIAVVVAMKLGEAVLLPLVLAVFLIIVGWPIQERLSKRVPRWLAFIITVLVILAASAIIGSALVWSIQRLTTRAPQLAERFHELSAQAVTWARANNIPIPAATSATVQERLTPIAGRVIALFHSTVAMLGLVLAYLALGLLEVSDFEAKVAQRLRRRLGARVLDTAGIISDKVRRHLVALSITSAISGVLTAIYAAAMGLDLAIIWGIVAFLLNYIPTIGPFIAVIPPSLFALLQFNGLEKPLAVFLGIGAIQFFIGNFVDPKIEGRVLSLSPLVVLFSVVFWGWMWGIFGAFLAVPLTMAIVVTCQQFESTRWVAALLSDIDDEERRNGSEAQGGSQPN